MEEEDDGGMDFEECDEDDIYGDLEADIFAAPPKRPRLDDVLQHEEYQNLTKEYQELKSKYQHLKRENKAYFSNISALYLTAKCEIDKKNFIIKNLSDKLKQVTKSKTGLSPKETEEILSRCQEALQESQAEVTLKEIKASLKNVSPTKAGKRKHIKFGNMSLYFFREQGSFQREEAVIYPRAPSTKETAPVGESKAPQNTSASINNRSQSNERRRTSSEERLKESVHLSTDTPANWRNSNSTNNRSESNERRRTSSEERLKESVHLSTDTPANRRNSNSAVVTNNGHQQLTHTSHVDSKEPCLPSNDVLDPDCKRQPSNERGASREECDRDKQNRRNSSGDRHNSYKNSRTRDYSPPGDRDRYNSRKGEDDRYYPRNRDYDSRKPDNYRRRDSRRSDYYNDRAPRRYNNDVKNGTVHRKHTRSRSRSKSK